MAQRTRLGSFARPYGLSLCLSVLACMGFREFNSSGSGVGADLSVREGGRGFNGGPGVESSSEGEDQSRSKKPRVPFLYDRVELPSKFRGTHLRARLAKGFLVGVCSSPCPCRLRKEARRRCEDASSFCAGLCRLVTRRTNPQKLRLLRRSDLRRLGSRRRAESPHQRVYKVHGPLQHRRASLRTLLCGRQAAGLFSLAWISGRHGKSVVPAELDYGGGSEQRRRRSFHSARNCRRQQRRVLPSLRGQHFSRQRDCLLQVL